MLRIHNQGHGHDHDMLVSGVRSGDVPGLKEVQEHELLRIMRQTPPNAKPIAICFWHAVSPLRQIVSLVIGQCGRLPPLTYTASEFCLMHSVEPKA